MATADEKTPLAQEAGAPGEPGAPGEQAEGSREDAGRAREDAKGAIVPSLEESAVPDSSLSIHDQVRQYYGSILEGSDDLKTNACCCSEAPPPKYVLDVIPLIEDGIIEQFYGCGSPIPPALEGCTVVDLGCGVGRDVYVLSKLVGPSGKVIGVDMTPSQLDAARGFQEVQAARFGFDESNVEFKLGYIEDLAELGIEDGSVDLVVSNCVINLSPFKEQVFREIYRVLKPGGELYFSDVFCDRRIPDELRRDPVLVGECLGGAMYVGDFEGLMRRCGWESVLYTTVDDIEVHDLNLESKLGFVTFTSRTVRAIKAEGLEGSRENYGQTAEYLGSIPEMPRYFDLDEDIRLIKGRRHAIDGDSARMLQQSRYGCHFKVSKPGRHRGPFDLRVAEDALSARAGRLPVDLGYLERALDRMGLPSFAERVDAPEVLKTGELETMQVNITYACNLACRHCYLECSPANKEAMGTDVMQACLDAFLAGPYKVMDITGGSPELHPNFEWFLRESAEAAREKGGFVIVRTNLTMLGQDEFAHLPQLFAELGVHLTASLPYFSAEMCDAQRGSDVFLRAMESIKVLNRLGYGAGEAGSPDALDGAGGAGSPGDSDGSGSGDVDAQGSPFRLPLDLAYNVSGPFLPPPQDLLEDLYKQELSESNGITFDNLFAFNNYPLGRFAADLLDANLFDRYLMMLHDNFNALAVQKMMCRSQVNVDVDGRLYDCEVNHVLGKPIQLPVDFGEGEDCACGQACGAEGCGCGQAHGADAASDADGGSVPSGLEASGDTRDATVFDIVSRPLPRRSIETHPVCYSCSAGFGSSCGGSLV